jgi:DNA-binding protein Fis
VDDLVGGDGGELLEAAHRIIEQPLLARLLSHVGDNQSEAAKRLGVSRNTIRKLLAKYGMLT